MGRRGPAKTPAHIARLRGNPGKRRINNDEPEFDIDASPPEDIVKDEIALAEWNRRAPELSQLGLLKAQYQTEFADYCFQHSHVRLWRQIQEIGIEAAIAKGLLKAFQTASQQRLRIAARFGFAPSDATGIAAQPKQSNDPADIYFQRRAGASRFLS